MPKGLSSAIDIEASTSPSTLCTASATATPPMPRPVSSGLICTPRLSSASRKAIVQIVSPAMKTMMSMEPDWAGVVVVPARRPRRSIA